MYKEITKFLITGAMATFIHGIVFIYSIKIGISPLISNTLAFSTAIIMSFLMQSKWVFGTRKIEKIYLLKFAITSLIGFLSNTLIVFIIMDILIGSEYVATILMIAITPMITFGLSKFWVFTHEKNESNKIKR